jgi:hypothetical protein
MIRTRVVAHGIDHAEETTRDHPEHPKPDVAVGAAVIHLPHHRAGEHARGSFEADAVLGKVASIPCLVPLAIPTGHVWVPSLRPASRKI